MKTPRWVLTITVASVPWAGPSPAAADALGQRSASFVVGDLLVSWQTGRGLTITYRGLPVFTPNPAELIVHRGWQEVFYRTERGNERATLEAGPDATTLVIRDRDEQFEIEKRVLVRRNGPVRVEYRYQLLAPEKADIQVLWGIGKPWIHNSQYLISVNGEERAGELQCPDQGRTDPWGGATVQTFRTTYGTLTMTCDRPLNILCVPDGGSLWYAHGLTRGERHEVAIEVGIEPGPALETGLRLVGLDWSKFVRNGRAAFTLRIARTPAGPERVHVSAEGPPGALSSPISTDLSETPKEIRCEVQAESKGELAFTLLLTDAAANKEVLRVGPLLVESSPYLRIMPQLSLYTFETTATIVADLADDLDRTGLHLALEDRTPQSVTARRTLLPLDITTFPNGVTQVTCRLLRGDQQLAEASTQIRKAPPKGNEVKIDNLTRSLIVDGLPFIPFGFYTYYPLKEGVMDGEVVRGFNLFSPYHGGPHEREKHAPIMAYLDRCAEIGMRVNYHLMWPYQSEMSDAQMALLRSEIETVRDHPALLSWYIADEPGLEYVPQLTKVYNLLKELDPYHPVTIVFCQGADHALKFSGTMDIVMADPYPIPQGPPTAVSRTADEFNTAFDFRLPLWIVPQAFGGNEWWQREPTAREQRVMTYLALIHGARGIQYFIRSPQVSFPKSPSMWAECGALALEAAELTPALTSAETAPSVTVSARAVHACALRHRGIVTVLAVNTDKKPQMLRIQVNGIDFTGEADVLFEDRTVTVEGGAIEEPIDGYGTRAYAIPIGQLAQDDLAVDPANLVVDPSWESTPSVGTPSACYASIPGAATCFVDSRIARHGCHSLRMTAPTAQELPSLTPYPVSLKAGQAYRVSVWSRAKSDGVVLKVSLGSLASQQFSLTREWKEYMFTVAPERDVRLSPGLALGTPGVAWLDLFQVVPQ